MNMFWHSIPKTEFKFLVVKFLISEYVHLKALMDAVRLLSNNRWECLFPEPSVNTGVIKRFCFLPVFGVIKARIILICYFLSTRPA